MPPVVGQQNHLSLSFRRSFTPTGRGAPLEAPGTAHQPYVPPSYSAGEPSSGGVGYYGPSFHAQIPLSEGGNVPARQLPLAYSGRGYSGGPGFAQRPMYPPASNHIAGRPTPQVSQVPLHSYRPPGQPPGPSLDRPSHLQYSSTPEPAQRSSVQVVIGSSPNLNRHEYAPISGPASGKSQTYMSHTPSQASSLPKRGKPQDDTTSAKMSSSTSKRRGRPSKNSLRTPSTPLVPKKRGRPFQTDAQKAASRAAREALSNAAGGDPKKRGRKFRVRHQLEIPLPEPIYIPFLCEWKGCPAELQNLETLRTHICNVHRKKQPSGTIACLWGKCGTREEVVNEETHETTVIEERLEFKTSEEWRNHVNESHLVPFAWHMGDGPKGTSLAKRDKSTHIISLAWLTDANGKQVTPSVEQQPIEDGRARVNNRRRFIKKKDGIYTVWEPIQVPEVYMKVHGSIPGTDDDDVDEERTDATEDEDELGMMAER